MDSIDDFEGSLEPVEYLARSPSRLAVLDAICEGSRTRNELKGLTDVSRVTLSRILANLEGRGWIERRNGRYEATSRGSFVATELTGVLANIETLDHLDGVMEWLPTEEFDFPLTCLQDADVSTASWGDHTAQIRHVAENIPGSDRIVATASGVSREVVDALWETTVDGDTEFEGIYDTTALEIVRTDEELRRHHRDMLESGTTGCLLYEGAKEPLLMVMVCDDTVILCGHDEDGPPPGTLETTDEAVRSWAESYVASVRAESTAIDPDLFRI
jgi:predicted transcriptional regulator